MSVHQTEAWVGEAIDAPARSLRTSVVTVALCAVAAILMQTLWLPIDADVSWLITVCEKMLGGARLYVDIIEINPPASVWLYLPLVWVAHVIGAKPEAVVASGFVAAGIGSSLCTVKLAARLNGAPNPTFVAFAAGFVTLVFPLAIFAQREHAALILVLPSLAALALIAEGKPLRPRVSVATGLAAGLVIAIKPHFALAIVPAALWAAYRSRSLKPLLPGAAAALAAVALYAAAFLTWASAYFALLPAISHTYLALHDSWWNVAVIPLLFPGLALLMAAIARPAKLPALFVVTALGALGFAAAAMAQAKNYPNHLYPGAALALFAALAVIGSSPPKRERRAVAFALAGACLWQMYQWAILPDPKLAAAIIEVAPPHPKIIALSPELTTGHSVTRNVGGTWVGSQAGIYFAGMAHNQNRRDAISAQAYRRDIQRFASDVARNSPDVILVYHHDEAWLMREPEIAAVMREYAPRRRAGGIEIWIRKADR
jgi:hypothetical protein